MLKKYAARLYWVPIFVLGSLYSVFLNISGKFGDSIITIFFLIGLLVYTFTQICKIHNQDLKASNRHNIFRLCIDITTLHLGVMVGMLVTSAPDNVSWMIDTYNLHLPMATNVMETLQGKINYIPTSHQGLGTHLWIGFLFYLFGKSIYTSIFGLHIIKLLTTIVVYKLGKAIWNEKAALYGAIIYGLSPMVFFYTFTFYKEGFVQLYVALAYLFLVKSLFGRKHTYLIPFICVLFALYI